MFRRCRPAVAPIRSLQPISSMIPGELGLPFRGLPGRACSEPHCWSSPRGYDRVGHSRSLDLNTSLAHLSFVPQGMWSRIIQCPFRGTGACPFGIMWLRDMQGTYNETSAEEIHRHFF